MLRYPATCLLILIQLFAGSGQSLYLCVGNDGSISGIDFGPAFCTNCRHDHDADSDELLASKVADSAEASCCGHTHKSSPVDHSIDSVSGNQSCDCDHLLISSESLRSSLPSLLSTALHASLVSLLQPYGCDVAHWIADGNAFRHYAPPPDIPAATAALSTVVIRS